MSIHTGASPISSWRRAVCYAVLIVSSVIAVFPLLWTISTSLKNRVDTFAMPPKFFSFSVTFENYRQILNDPNFSRAFLATAQITVIATLICVVAGFFAAYALARLPHFIGREVLGAVIIVVRILPGIVLVVPLYTMAVQLGFYDSKLAVGLVMAALNLPFVIWLMMPFIQQIPVELEEAARIDGASQGTVIWRIVLPLTLPGLASTVILVAFLCWNEFLVPLVLTDNGAKTLPVYTAGFITARTVEWGPLAAASTVAFLPIAVLVVFAQRYLISGLSMGAIKS